MRSRLRVAASTGLVISGLVIAGVGGALAFADPERDRAQNGHGSSSRSDSGDHRYRGKDRGPGGGGDGDAPRPSRSGPPPTDKPTDQPTKPGGNPTRTEQPGEPSEPSNTRTPPQTETPTDTKTETPTEPTKTEPTEPTKTEPTSPTKTEPTETPSSTTPTPTSVIVGLPEIPGGDSDGVGGVQAPFNYPSPPDMQLAATPPPGPVAAGGTEPLAPPIGVLPVIVAPILPPFVAPFVAPPGSDHSPRSGSGSGPDAQPTAKLQIDPGLPAAIGLDAGLPPASFRAGYSDYLRTATTMEIAVMALPGVTGLLTLTGLGGLVGYRQAKAGRTVRIDATRFMK